MNAYLLTFDTDRYDRRTLLSTIDAMEEIANWYAFFPGSVAIVSEHDAKSVANALRHHLPKAPFLITSIERGSRAGFLPRSVWKFIKDPQSVDRLAS
ncbi:hypothetical protein [Fulvimarina sp. 2208YS6-2-32]|uniref:hypothetical protein n=1 Tax=Fulvimarina uroteuthidis TaxID=3098149 RepID=UPI002AC97959|nr:hypothetical protein [Fulvimarina sp. 2208YS6-2-32]